MRKGLSIFSVVVIELLWGGKTRSIQNSNQCAEVFQTLSQARQHQPALTPSFGFMIIGCADGTTNQYFLSPAAGLFSSLEIVTKQGGYAISMDEMVRTFKKVGLLDEHWE